MYFLTVNIFLTFLRMNFWHYVLFILFLLMALTYLIFLIFYDDLNFCSFTIFGSIKFAVEYFITRTLYFTKSVIYLRDIVVSTKENFQIRLTLIRNSSDCKNMIAFFAFSFILLFLLPPHKRGLRLKACISTIFSNSHFSFIPKKIPEFS